MEDHSQGEVSGLLLAWRRGDATALERLLPLVYDELHAIARRHLRGEQSGHTLQTTDLIHEAYLRLVGADVAWQGRLHFLAVAASTMRRILVDHARARGRDKRGGGVRAITLDPALAAPMEPSIDLLALDEALTRLAGVDQRKGRIVELHYFGGLTYDEAAEVLEVSAATVHRELRAARAWLYREMNPVTEGGG